MSPRLPPAALLLLCVLPSALRAQEPPGQPRDSLPTLARVPTEPVPVSVIGPAEVRLALLRNPADVVSLLTEGSGVWVQRPAGGLGVVGLRVAGLGGREPQLLIDGLPLAGAGSGRLAALQMPPIGLARVEATEAPASARYGTHASGGVIDLISRRPDGQGEVLYNETSRGATDALVHWSGPARPLSYTVTGGLHEQSIRDLDDDGWADLPAYRRITVRPRAFWDGSRGTLLATAGGVWERREGGTPAGKRLKNGVQYREQLETRRADAGLNGRYLARGGMALEVRAAAVRDRRQRILNNAASDDARSFALLEGSLVGRRGAHSWRAGASLERDSYSGYEVQTLDYRFTSPALFAEDRFRVREDLMLAGSARADFHSEYGTLFDPRVAALYHPGPWLLRISGGTGSFAPTPFNDVTEAVGLRTVQPLGQLEPERVRSISFDAGRQLGPVALTASVFGTTVRDPVQARAALPGQLEIGNVAGPIRARGGELFARARLGAVRAFASWRYLEATEADPDSAGHRRDLPLTPRQSARLLAEWVPGRLGRIAGEASYVGEQALADDPFRTRSRPYWLLGLLGEVRLGRASVFLNAENLLDVRQADDDPLVRPARSRTGLWVTDTWAPVAGRVLNGGVRVLLGS